MNTDIKQAKHIDAAKSFGTGAANDTSVRLSGVVA